MKRFLSFTLVAVMLLSTLSLTSCGVIDFFKGFFNPDSTTTETTTTDKEVVTTVTKEELEAIYSSKNYTLEYTDYTGDITTIVASEEGADIKNFAFMGIDYIVDATTGALISKTNLGYVGGLVSLGEEAADGYDTTLSAMGYFPELKHRDLVYDESTKSYTLSNKNWKGTLQFEDGLLVKAVLTAADEEDCTKVTLSNVGTTTFDLPEYINITDGIIEHSKAGKDVVTTITTEEIEVLFDENNFTISANLVIAEMLIKTTVDSTLTKLSLLGEVISEVYTTCIDNEWYELTEDLDGYVASKNGYEGSIVDSLGDFSNNWKLEDLTYNEEGRYYSYSNDGKDFYLYFENGRLVQFTIVGDLGLGFGDGMEIVCFITDVGTTEIELPEFVIVEDDAE